MLYWLILGIFWGLWRASPLAELGAGALDGNQLIAYLAVTEWIAFAVSLPYREIEADIQGGAIAMRLARPFPYNLAMLATWAGEVAYRVIMVGAAGMLAVLYSTGAVGLTPTGAALLAFAGMLSALLVLLWHLQIGHAAVWMGISAPLFWIWQKFLFVLGGLIMPLTIYPPTLGAIAKASPFAAMLFAPGSLVFDGSWPHSAGVLGQQLFWLGVSALSAVAVERAAQRRIFEQRA
jgi:ABC-2 type transport system permease protein